LQQRATRRFTTGASSAPSVLLNFVSTDRMKDPYRFAFAAHVASGLPTCKKPTMADYKLSHLIICYAPGGYE